MSTGETVEQLLALPDMDAQVRYLEAHASLLDDALADSLKQHADRYLRSDVQRSLRIASLLGHAGRLAGNPCYQALGLLAQANCRCMGGLGEYQRSLALYDQATDIYRAAGRVVDQAISKIGKLYALACLGRYQEALETGAWAAQILQEHEQWRRLAAVTLNLGLIRGRMGEDEPALALIDRAKELYGQLGDEGKALLPWADQNRAIVLRNLGQFAASIQASQSAAELLTQLGQTAEAARARQNLAVTYFVLGRYNEALELLDDVLQVFLADGRHRDAVLVELYVSDCLLQLRRFTDVLDKCRHIREAFVGLNARFEVAQALLNEAVAFAGLNRYTQARHSLDEARRLFVLEGNQIWIAVADLETAALYLRIGQPADSLATAQNCADVFQGHHLPIREAQARLVAARARLDLGQGEDALRAATQALALIAAEDVPALAHQCHHLLAILAEAREDRRTAQLEYEQAIRELERLRGRLMVEHRADFLEDKQGLYQEMVRFCLDAGRPDQALAYAERAKSRALLDLLAYRLDLGLHARKNEDLPLIEELIRLRAERDRRYRRWEGREDVSGESWETTEQIRRQARDEVLALEKQITDLWHRLLVRNADYAREAGLWQVQTEPAQPHLSPESALLEYFFVHEQPVVFLVTAETFQVHRLPGSLTELQRLLQLFWLNVRAVPQSAPERTARMAENARGLLARLHGLLIAPLAAALLPYAQLIIVPHGPLHYLPFHALFDGESHLIERHEISYLPGSSLLRYTRGPDPTASDAVVFGHSCQERLPYACREAAAVAARLKGQLYLEDEASLASLLAIASHCRVIHLAAHGEFRSDNPLFSGLALADGWLTTFDLFNLPLRASLVTLSACQTGQSVLGGGDELFGLMRALLYAGTSSAVLSLWTVEDRSTALLMETFYDKLAEGWRKGTALRHAQQQFLKERAGQQPGPYAHPYFWAPFFLIGQTGQL